MPISGLSIVLASDAQRAEQACEAMRCEPRLEIGERHGARLAVVSETQSTEEDRQLWNWLWDLPGVVHVDVAFIHFDASASPVADDDTQLQHADDVTAHDKKGREP